MPKPYLFLVPVLGLAAVTGSVGAVGMAGLTLGGGRTLRCYGRILSISTLSAASIVRYDASTAITREPASAI